MPEDGGREIQSSQIAAQLLFWTAAAGGTVLDLVSKAIVFHFCKNKIVLIPGFLSISPVENYGGVWGIGKGYPVFFIVLTVAALIAILVFRRRYHPGSKLAEFAFGLVLAGALGNLWDRILTFPKSCVRDFIDVQLHLPRLEHWPTFNLADAFICIGVFLLLLHSFQTPEKGAP